MDGKPLPDLSRDRSVVRGDPREVTTYNFSCNIPIPCVSCGRCFRRKEVMPNVVARLCRGLGYPFLTVLPVTDLGEVLIGFPSIKKTLLHTKKKSDFIS